MSSKPDVTRYLSALSGGNGAAVQKLWPLVYEELRRLAAACFRDESAGHTLQPTVLVHEAYLRLVGDTQVTYQGRAEFFALASQVMRRLLIDHARRRRAAKRGGAFERVELDEIHIGWDSASDDYVLALDEALQRMGQIDPRLVRLVELRFFGGMTFDESAEMLGVSTVTAKRMWKLAKAWLHREVTKGGSA